MNAQEQDTPDRETPGGRSRHRHNPAGGPILERRTDDLYLTLVENSVVGLVSTSRGNLSSSATSASPTSPGTRWRRW